MRFFHNILCSSIFERPGVVFWWMNSSAMVAIIVWPYSNTPPPSLFLSDTHSPPLFLSHGSQMLPLRIVVIGRGWQNYRWWCYTYWKRTRTGEGRGLWAGWVFSLFSALLDLRHTSFIQTVRQNIRLQICFNSLEGLFWSHSRFFWSGWL